jgi:signal transduction histidine kinase
MSSSLTDIAMLHNKIKDYELAKKHAQKALIIADETGAMVQKLYSSEQLYIAFEGLADFENALLYHKIFLSTKDSLFNIEKIKELESIEALYQAEKKQLEIENLEKENLLKTVKLEKMNSRQLFSYIVISIFILVIISLIVIRNKLKKQKATISKQNEEINNQKNELEKHRNHLEKLVKERTKDLEIAKNKAEESDRLKTAFLTNMSHEIRTPMNAIVGFSQILNEKGLTDTERDKFIAQINSSTDTLLMLIDDILDLAKIEANEITIHESKFELQPLLEDILASGLVLKESENIKLKLHSNPSKIFIYSDKIRVRQVLLNLMSNACKFTETGSIEIGHRLNNNHLSIFVKDTGIGIPKENLGKIFDRFIKAGVDKNKLFRGAGLGLTISKKIALLLGGDLIVESELGKGSTFSLLLPIERIKTD